MYINTTFMPFKLQMIPYNKGLEQGLYKPWGGWGQPYPQSEFSNNPEHGTPFAITVDAWLNSSNACIILSAKKFSVVAIARLFPLESLV